MLKNRKKEINPDNIIMLVADSNYTLVHLIDGTKYLYAITLRKFEGKFSNYSFIRPHRSILLNSKFISQICQVNSMQKSLIIKMITGEIINVSRRKTSLIKELRSCI
jgi:DNA-binding LytR/AlgR family response regulator